MATEKRELLLDLLARDRTEAATHSAAKNVDHVGDSAQKAGEKTKKFGKTTVVAGSESEKFGRSASGAGRDVDKLSAEIKLLERELESLARSFARADDKAERLDLSKSIRRAENDIRRLNKSKGILESILPEPSPEQGRSWASKALKGIAAGISSGGDAIAGAASNHVGIIVGGAIGAAAAPVVVSALGSALSAGAGLGVIGAGIALAIKGDDTLQQAGKDAGNKFIKGLQIIADKQFQAPVLEAIHLLSKEGEKLTSDWGKAFAALAPQVRPFTQDLIKAADTISGSLTSAAAKSGPALDGLGDSLVLLSGGVSSFINVVADGGPQAADNLRLIAGATADVIAQTGNFLGVLNKLSNNVWLTGPLLPLLRKHYRDAAAGSDELSSKTGKLVVQMSNAEKAARGQRDALSELSKEMKAEADPVFGLLNAEDKLAAAQKNVADATKQHGAKSKETQQAVRDLALAAIDLQGKAGALGGTFNGKLTPAMRNTLAAAGLTASEIDNVERQFKQAKSAGDKYAKTYRAKVITDYVNRYSAIITSSAQSAYEQTKAQIAGKRAEGGPVRKNKAYVVGEKRAEVFVPDHDGTIVPSIDQLTGRSGGAGGRSGSSSASQVDVLVRAAPNASRDLVGMLVEAMQYECRIHYGKSAQRMFGG